MNRVDVTELHFIAPIANVPLILKYGILSHRLAEKHVHDSVAMQEVQDRRKDKQIPGARLLHEYANLYFDAHNPMLSKRRDQNDTICILHVFCGWPMPFWTSLMSSSPIAMRLAIGQGFIQSRKVFRESRVIAFSHGTGRIRKIRSRNGGISRRNALKFSCLIGLSPDISRART